MHYEGFIDRVRERTGLEDKHLAEIAVRAFFETLGERLHRTEREKLAAQLPNQLKEFIVIHPAHDFFGLEEFYTRVASRAGVRYPHGVGQAKAIVTVLKEAVSPGELADVLADLTSDYGELFGEKEVTPLSPSAV
jgi:uncharacterized protein (DUF2267 family)